jgi:hypothetical protein
MPLRYPAELIGAGGDSEKRSGGGSPAGRSALRTGLGRRLNGTRATNKKPVPQGTRARRLQLRRRKDDRVATGRRGVSGRGSVRSDVVIRIRARIGGVTVVRRVRVAVRSDAVALRGRQGARSGGEENNASPRVALVNVEDFLNRFDQTVRRMAEPEIND